MRDYIVSKPDPFELADTYGITREDLAVHIGVTPRRLREMVRDYRHAGRVRRAVLEVALERERLAGLLP